MKHTQHRGKIKRVLALLLAITLMLGMVLGMSGLELEEEHGDNEPPIVEVPDDATDAGDGAPDNGDNSDGGDENNGDESPLPPDPELGAPQYDEPQDDAVPEAATKLVSPAGTFEGFEYDVIGSEIIITGYSGAGGKVTIPHEIDSLPVTAIDEWAFDGKHQITGVVVPGSVRDVGEFAFHNCKGITEVYFHEGVEFIGYQAFVWNDNLAKVTIPASLTLIADWAFYGVASNFAIYGYPDTYAQTYAGDWGFPFVSLDATITEYGLIYETIDGATITITGYIGAGGKVIIPDEIDSLPVTAIADDAFYKKENITSVVISGNVKTIGEYAFDGCVNLAEVYIHEGVTTIGFCAFIWNDNLNSITIPASVTFIGEWAFYGAWDLAIYGFAGTEAQTYAEEKDIPFVPLASAAYVMERFGENLTISAGDQHTVVLKPDGIVWGLGANFFNQLGDGTTENSATPVQAQGISNVVAVSAGDYHTVALKSDGTVWTWGAYADYSFEVGPIPTIWRSGTPVQVEGIVDVVAIASGDNHAAALKSDGTVWAWGRNDSGQLGNGTTVNSLVPVQAQGVGNVVAIGAGLDSISVLKSDGTVWTWGGYNGAFGDGTTTNSLVPVQASISDVVAISVEYGRIVALKSDGTAWKWGQHIDASGVHTAGHKTPVQVEGLGDVAAVAAGTNHTVALKSDGTVWAWGHNQRGELGDGTTTVRVDPVQVQGIGDVAAISAGFVFTIALKPDGTLWGWGLGSSGQLGNWEVINATPRFVMAGVKLPPSSQASTPAAPILMSRTATSIALKPIPRVEYRRSDQPGAWQDSPVFTGLAPNTGYTFCVRLKATATAKASGESAISETMTTLEQSTLTGTVTISGGSSPPRYGETLTANTSGLGSAPSVPLGDLYYQWKRDGTNISGAVSSTYTLISADIGATITVTVTATNATGEATSAPTGAVAKADAPALADVPKVVYCEDTETQNVNLAAVVAANVPDGGGLLTYAAGTVTGTNPGIIAYSANTVTGISFAIAAGSSAGQTATIPVTIGGFTNYEDATVNVVVTLTEADAPQILGGTVAITGTAKFGQTLTANTSDLTPSEAAASANYQWKRGNTNIPGANSKTYTLVAADVGQSITVTATAPGYEGSVTSSPVTAAKADGAAVSGAPSASGTPTQNSITVSAITNAGGTGQSVEYAIGTSTTAPTVGWQSGRTFTGLSANTAYYIFARTASNATHEAGAARRSAAIKTAEATEKQLIEAFVTRLYWQALGRAPDLGGLGDWVAKLASGRETGASVAYAFFLSPVTESLYAKQANSQRPAQKGPGDATYWYVERLYQGLLGRPSDSQRVVSLARFDPIPLNPETNWPREAFYVVQGFIESPEYYEVCAKMGISIGSTAPPREHGVPAFVDRVYRVFIGRRGEPWGLNQWTDDLLAGRRTGSSLLEAMVLEPTKREYLDDIYYGKHAVGRTEQQANELYVLDLYRGIFNRTPDSPLELGYMREHAQKITNAVNNASAANKRTARENAMRSLLKEFTTSREFRELCDDYSVRP